VEIPVADFGRLEPFGSEIRAAADPRTWGLLPRQRLRRERMNGPGDCPGTVFTLMREPAGGSGAIT